MKKLLLLISVFSFGGISSINVTSCGQSSTTQAIDLSKINITPPNLIANSQTDYASLNKDNLIITAVIKAVNDYHTNSNPSNITDFIITNDQNPLSKQVADTEIVFTVASTSTSTILKPNTQTNFKLTLKAPTTKIDLSLITVIPPLNIVANTNLTYNDLNLDSDIIDAVITGIKTYDSSTDPQINTDFIITNDQNPLSKQVADTEIVFTVASTSTSTILKPNTQTNFKLTLKAPTTKIDLIQVTVGSPFVKANENLTYQDLNKNNIIINLINQGVADFKTGTQVEVNIDYIITNDQNPQNNQTVGTLVKFTATANENSTILVANTKLQFTIKIQ